MTWDSGLTGTPLNIAATPESPLRVVAGPGTGKSFALKRRVARLLEEGADPRRILSVTFTRTAARSLVDDLCHLGVTGCDRIKAGTLHAFCYDLLSKASVFDYLGRVPRPLVSFSKSGVLQFEGAPLLQDICDSGAFGSKRAATKRLRAFDAAWARLQSEEPGWPRTSTDREFQSKLMEWLIFHNAILIGELVPLALRFLRENPAAPERTFYQHILVDEYQDLNKAEQVLIDLLCQESTQTLVGDPDQSIYNFRHANPQGIMEFSLTHPGTHDEVLIECRRCPSAVVTLADHLIRHNYQPSEPARLQPLPANPEGEIYIVQWENILGEAEGLAEFCHHLIHEREYIASDILILTPRRILGYGIRDALRELDIPAHSFYHEELLDNDKAQEQMAILTLLCNSEDRVALRFLLGLGSPTWNSRPYRLLAEHCSASSDSPWQVMSMLVDGTLRIAGTRPLQNRFNKIREQLEEVRSLRGYALLDALFEPGVDWSETIRDVINLYINSETDPSTLRDLLVEHITQPEMPEEGDFTRIMSLHKSKGLTSKAVIVAGCIEGLIPTLNPDHTRAEAAANLSEQRRLFYVALTRCREILVVSSAVRLAKRDAFRMGAEVTGRGLIVRTVTSRFIHELGSTAPVPKTGAAWTASDFT